MRVTVLTGGASAERAVALAGGAQMVAALRARGHVVHVVDTTSGPLEAADEARMLSSEVGKVPPSVDDLDQRERRFLSQELATLAMVRNADVLCLALHAGRGEGGVVQAI
ncbi:MAG: D-alanine--D-alanine ligase, partial [Acidimicrobiales bacterium]